MTNRRIRYDPRNDLYSVLGVPPTAGLDEIRRAYRQKAKVVHPDLNPDNSDWAHTEFQRVNDAHDVLTDPNLRAEYDARRRYLRESSTTGAGRGAESLREASRAVWARRHRQRYYPGMFFLGLVVMVFSCVALNLSSSRDATPEPLYIPPTIAPTVILISGNNSVAKSFANCANPDEKITEPINGAAVTDQFHIRGTAGGRNFQTYTLMLGVFDPGDIAIRGYPLQIENPRSVSDGLLIPPTFADMISLLWAIIPDRDLTFRLVVTEKNGNSLPPCDVMFHFTRRVPI